MKSQPHFFFAIKIPDQTKAVMKDHIEKLKLEVPFSRWVHHEDLHITLAFLGSASPEQLKNAKDNVREAVSCGKPFSLKINRLGFFGRVDSPRVFWADLETSDSLLQIREMVFLACEKAGFTLETRPFRPHITLARKWTGDQPFDQKLLDLWEELQPAPLEFEAADVILYQTHLDKTPKYEPITVFSLIHS